ELARRVVDEVVVFRYVCELVEPRERLVALLGAVPLLAPDEAVVAQLTYRQHGELDGTTGIDRSLGHHLEERDALRDSEDVDEAAPQVAGDIAQGARRGRDRFPAAERAEAGGPVIDHD